MQTIRMLRLLVHLGVLVLFACHSEKPISSTNYGWTLVYKHNEQGELIFGQKEKVIEAVRNGLSVKVGYGVQVNEDRSIEHIADAQFLTVLSVQDTIEVFAQISPIMRQGPFRLKDTVGIKLAPGYKWLTAIGTNGMCSNVMVNTFADTIQGSNEKRRAAMWFVDYPPQFESVVKKLTL